VPRYASNANLPRAGTSARVSPPSQKGAHFSPWIGQSKKSKSQAIQRCPFLTLSVYSYPSYLYYSRGGWNSYSYLLARGFSFAILKVLDRTPWIALAPAPHIDSAIERMPEEGRPSDQAPSACREGEDSKEAKGGRNVLHGHRGSDTKGSRMRARSSQEPKALAPPLRCQRAMNRGDGNLQ
jgi:hypothetical protein